MPDLTDLTDLVPALSARAEGRCELCSTTLDLQAVVVPPEREDRVAGAVLVCGTCAGHLAGEVEVDPRHWFCLRESMWSEVPAVQVLAWRVLMGLGTEGWAVELLEQIYLDDETRAWAEAGQEGGGGAPATVDSNGNTLADGDNVTLIKDLDVKGANFTAKRGTLVKGIRLTEDPGLVEGRVNKVTIFLKTEFLKKSG